MKFLSEQNFCDFCLLFLQMSCRTQRHVATHFSCTEKFLWTQIFANWFSLTKIAKICVLQKMSRYTVEVLEGVVMYSHFTNCADM